MNCDSRDERRGQQDDTPEVRNDLARWRAFTRRRRALIVRGVVESLVYPVAIIVASALLAIVLAPEGADERRALLYTLLSDLAVALGFLVVPVALALEALGNGSAERRWLAYWWKIVAELGGGVGLAAALQAVPAPSPDGESPSVRLHAKIARGADIATALVSAGCPEPFPTVLRQATGEADLPSLLTRRLLAIQDRLIRRAEVRLRLAQPLALATAGVTVMWLVVRVVLPVITHRMEGLQP
jgi:hypothetical protein